MKSQRALLPMVCAIAVAGVLALESAASAQPCTAGCGAEKRACVQTARTTKQACKTDCRAAGVPGELGACMRGCTGVFRAAKDVCRDERRSCHTECEPGSPSDPACPGSCGQALGACARGVAADTKACKSECRGAPDRGACAGACAEAARAGLAACRSEFSVCRGACEGSPDAAFLD
jgi:hypothetical protein